MHGEKQASYGALVSVIVPTLGRPEMVMRAVSSVLAQSYAPLEVVVVIDGPDEETARALRQFKDTRIKVLMLKENVGGAEGRNIGVREARGEWVAFLDDDDAWMPEKLTKQMELAATMQARYPVVSTRVLVRGPKSSRVLPRRLYRSGSDMSEYLFCRYRFSYGDGLLQTSTLLAKRSLLLQAPFSFALKRHQDWDWLLKVSRRSDVAIAMLPDVLTVMQVEAAGGSVSRSLDWEFSLAWARQNRQFISRKAYSFFVVTECVPRALKSGVSWIVLLQLFGESLRRGEPGIRQSMLFLGFCLFPEGARKELQRRMPRVMMGSGTR